MKKNAWIAGVTAVMTAGLIFMSPVSARAESVIPAGVYVGGISLEGMTAIEAEKAVKEFVEAKMDQMVELNVNGIQTNIRAEDLGLNWNNPETGWNALDGAKAEGNLIKRYMKMKDIQENPVNVELELDVDQEKLSAIVTETCGEAFAEAQDAAIVRKNNAFVVTPSVTGIAMDVEATERAINDALNREGTEDVAINAVMIETEPRIKTEDLETIQDKLGSFSTGFSTSGWARSTNLEVGTSKINGRVLMPGDVLSGYECMAPLTIANGYKVATAYENGRSVDSVAGGVCQIATTLYNAALYAELEIVQRQNHSMTVAYVDHSRDAAIAGTYKDIKISNPYDTPVYVEGYTSGKTLVFNIYGKETRPANRTIKFESKTLQWISPGDPIEEFDASLQPGQRVEVQSSHTGIRSELYKCVYIDGTLQEKTLLNKDSYMSSKAIYRVGPAVAEEAKPAEAKPAEIPAAETPAADSAPADSVPAGPSGVVTPIAPAANPAGSTGPTGPGSVSGPGMTTGPGASGPGAM